MLKILFLLSFLGRGCLIVGEAGFGQVIPPSGHELPVGGFCGHFGDSWAGLGILRHYRRLDGRRWGAPFGSFRNGNGLAYKRNEDNAIAVGTMELLTSGRSSGEERFPAFGALEQDVASRNDEIVGAPGAGEGSPDVVLIGAEMKAAMSADEKNVEHGLPKIVFAANSIRQPPKNLQVGFRGRKAAGWMSRENRKDARMNYGRENAHGGRLYIDNWP